ncbi:MAG TPA: sensor histidine kinase [Albitalea sp.]|nr:sensor histidine kinase [Albitalea sp.]
MMGRRGERPLLALASAKRSLHRQLFAWLLLPQIVLWIAGAYFTYNLTGRYANAAVDASLLQASRSLARQVKPMAHGLFIDFPRSAQDILEADPADRVLYTVSAPPGEFILGNRSLPPPPDKLRPVLGEPYFYDGVISLPREGRTPAATERVRIVALYLLYGDEGARAGTMLVQVARSSANREELARRILIDTALPLSALIALMTLIVWAGIRAGLKPLAALQRRVEGRRANDLAPIEIEAAPLEVRSLARAINTLLAEVDHSVKAQKRFISDAAHQLRTPLAGLKTQAEIAMRDSKDPELQERLRRVHESASRSAHLVAQMLALARAEPESAAQQSHVPVDLSELAREVTTEWVPRALAAHIDLGFDEVEPASDAGAPAAPALVRGVPLLLREALVNVLDNAIRYAGRDATVTVRVRASADSVTLEVEDNGPGVPAADMDRVFERFVRVNQDGLGCGLGLSIVREIVARHGGTVRLEPVAPHGLLIRAIFPRVR